MGFFVFFESKEERIERLMDEVRDLDRRLDILRKLVGMDFFRQFEQNPDRFVEQLKGMKSSGAPHSQIRELEKKIDTAVEMQKIRSASVKNKMKLRSYGVTDI